MRPTPLLASFQRLQFCHLHQRLKSVNFNFRRITAIILGNVSHVSYQFLELRKVSCSWIIPIGKLCCSPYRRWRISTHQNRNFLLLWSRCTSQRVKVNEFSVKFDIVPDQTAWSASTYSSVLAPLRSHGTPKASNSSLANPLLFLARLSHW